MEIVGLKERGVNLSVGCGESVGAIWAWDVVRVWRVWWASIWAWDGDRGVRVWDGGESVGGNLSALDVVRVWG